jgi:hypothetical protein
MAGALLHSCQRRRLALERLFINGPDLKRDVVLQARVFGNELDRVIHVAGFHDADAAELTPMPPRCSLVSA